MYLASPKHLNVLGCSEAFLIHPRTMHSSYILQKWHTIHYMGHLVQVGGGGGSSIFVMCHEGIVEQRTTPSLNLGSGWNCCSLPNLLGDNGMGNRPFLFPLRPTGRWIYTLVLRILVRIDGLYCTKNQFVSSPD